MALVLQKPVRPAIDLSFMTGDPKLRPPNWRWRAACWLASNPQPKRRLRLDEWTRAAYKYRQLDMEIVDLFKDDILWKKYPGLYTAQKYYFRADPGMRWLLEAYLCADASRSEISQITGLPMDAIAYFANVFFDVAGKTSNWGYMLTEALGKPYTEKISDGDIGMLWKIYGLLKGPHMLNILIQQDASPGRANSAAAALASLQDLVSSSVQVKTLYAARMMGTTYQPTEIINANSRLREVETNAKAGSVAGSSGSVTAGLSAVLAVLKFNIAGADALTAEELAANRETLIASEPRAVERLRLANLQVPNETTPE